MALTQMQLIQSLGEAMAWFERERTWGTPATELRHLCGRIGELYAAVMTNGQMATKVNQPGYDIVTKQGERVSVKTTAMSGHGGHVSFNPNSMDEVDRVMILRINEEEMEIQTLFDDSLAAAKALMRQGDGRHSIPLSVLRPKSKPVETQKKVRRATWANYRLEELESGTILAFKDDAPVQPVRPILREIASALGVGVRNGQGNPFNTRQLGTVLIDELLGRTNDLC